jgi:type IV pilus assembly protein PilB
VLQKEGFTQAQIDAGITIYKPKGCDKCKNGYKGRVGIYEVVKVTPKISQLIMAEADSLAIAAAADDEGFNNLRKSALIKAIEGVTSLEEVERVTSE